MKTDATHLIENRSPTFYSVGYWLSCAVVVLFTLTTLTTFFAAEFWSRWVFSNTIPLTERCSPEAFVGASESSSKVDSNGVKITCAIPDLPEKTLAYAHFGWVSGEEVSVSVNGTLFAKFKGTEKIIVPVRSADQIVFLASYTKVKSAEGQSTATAEKTASVGFIGAQKPSIAIDRRTNINLLGLDILLGLTRTINNLAPVLSLGLVIALAWFGGFRGRSLLMGLHVLLWASVYRLVRLAPVLTDLNQIDIQGASLGLRFGFAFATLLFQMEIARVFPKKIYPLARAALGVFVLYGTAVTLGMGRSPAFLQYSVFCFQLIIGTSLLGVALLSQQPAGMSRRAVGVTGFIAGALFTADAITSLTGDHFMLSSALEFLLPIYVALLLLVTMSRSDVMFRREKAHTVTLTDQINFEVERVQTLARFLPQTLVNQFQSRASITEKIDRVLQPHRSDIAVVQADLRGFSDLMRGTDHAKVLSVLKECFGPVVDHAQKYCMVKLVGDCLFAFIEEQQGPISSTDRALEIASLLVRQVESVNRNGDLQKELKFGIAINYGPAIVGNLSSDQCIDYTAIGETVNLAARLEELSKAPAIATKIGKNAVILSDAALKQIETYGYVRAHAQLLTALHVRSFESVKSAWFLSEQSIAHLSPGAGGEFLSDRHPPNSEPTARSSSSDDWVSAA